jgi:ABC-type amino acid transport substrate-binding protein
LRAVIRYFLPLVMFLLPAQQVLAQTIVNVGAYNFPPYIIQAESENPSGLLIDLLEMLNQQQTDFRFVLVPTSVTRRYQDMASGRFDLIPFESADWGWQDQPHQSIDMGVSDADVYVAKAQPGRDQRYFDSFADKRLALYAGFHYSFAGFNADRDVMRQRYQADFSYSHESNLLRVLFDRSDITVVSQSYLDTFIEQNPKSAEQFLVSTKQDQVYHHQILLRPGAPISPDQLRALRSQLHESGQLDALLQRYHLHLEN